MKKELSYRHMLVAAMPIQLLLFLIKKNLLEKYLDNVLSIKYKEELVYKLISRRDLQESISWYKHHYIKLWLGFPGSYLSNYQLAYLRAEFDSIINN